MKNILNITATLLLLTLTTAPAHAWNQNAKYINALAFNVDGSIKFTLFDNGRSGSEQMCSEDNPWFRIETCSSPNADRCITYAERLGKVLMNAKISNKAVHIEKARCSVFEVALKP